MPLLQLEGAVVGMEGSSGGKSMRVTIEALGEDRDVLHEKVYCVNRQVERVTSSNEPERESDDGFQNLIDCIDRLTEERDRERNDSNKLLRALEGRTVERWVDYPPN